MAILEVSRIEKRFGDVQVLRDISFTLDKGQSLAVIGSSGSGKTTLLRCLNFLERPDGGTIAVGAGPSSTLRTPPPAARSRSAAAASTSAWCSRASTSSPSIRPWTT